MQLDAMTVAQMGVLRLLLEGAAWQQLDDLVEALGYREVERAKLLTKGRGLAAVQDACEQLQAAGWVSLQDRPGGLTVTLSPEGGDRLGVELCLKRKTPRWKRVVDRPFPSRLGYVPNAELDRVESPRPSAEEAVAAEEARDDELLIHPVTFKSGKHWIWPWRHAQCETLCRHHPLPNGHHCLYCGRPSWEVPDDEPRAAPPSERHDRRRLARW